MSISRQQRRAMQRKMAGITNDQAERMITALKDAGEAKRTEARKLAPGIVNDVMAKMQRDWEPIIRERVRNETIAEMLILVTAFLHIDKHHTGKYLIKWTDEFMQFVDAVEREGGGVEELRQILIDECDVKPEDVYAHKDAEKEQAELEAAS